MKKEAFYSILLVLSLFAVGCETTPKEQAYTDKDQGNEPISTLPTTVEITENKVEEVKLNGSGEFKDVKRSTVAVTEFKAPTYPINGKIVILNLKNNFVVIDFGRGNKVPPVKSELGVYRDDQFVGSVRLTKPIKDNYATGEVLTGSLNRGDTVR